MDAAQCGHAISVYVNTDEYKWRKIYLSDFTQLGNVEQMYSFIDALELSCLDTGMWVRIGEQSMVVGEDRRKEDTGSAS